MIELVIILVNGFFAWQISSSIIKEILGNSPIARLARLIIGGIATLWFVSFTMDCNNYNSNAWYSGFVVLGPTGLVIITFIISLIHDYMYKDQD